MKTQIEIPPKLKLSITIIFVVSIVVAFFFFRSKYLIYRQSITELISQEINGRVINLKAEGKGSYFVDFGTAQIHSLPIAFQIEKYNITIGDSVYKMKGSTTIIFFKTKNGKTQKNYEYEIRL